MRDHHGKKNPRWKHGCWGTRTYRVWKNMRSRCNNPNAHRYHRYGGRGIKVCERWDSYLNFVADMGEASVGMSIERIDNDGNYEPGNCRWATPIEQGANTLQNRMITFDGETLHLSEWARRRGVNRDVLWKRITRNGIEKGLAIE